MVLCPVSERHQCQNLLHIQFVDYGRCLTNQSEAISNNEERAPENYEQSNWRKYNGEDRPYYLLTDSSED